MNITQYKCTSPRLEGEIIITYHDGVLYNILFKSVLAEKQFEVFKVYLSNEEAHVMRLTEGGLIVTPLKVVSGHEKVLLFIKYYEHYIKDGAGKSVPYKKGSKDHLYIKNYEVTHELLTVYFTSKNILFTNKHSLENYKRHYNELRAEAGGAYKDSGNKHPNEYSLSYEQTLKTPDQLQSYWRHLIACGWEADKRSGHVIWRKKPTT
jgi:hypothetical protein